MKTTTGTITIGGKELYSIIVDYDSYTSDIGTITINNKTYTSTQSIGVEEEE